MNSFKSGPCFSILFFFLALEGSLEADLSEVVLKLDLSREGACALLVATKLVRALWLEPACGLRPLTRPVADATTA